MSAICVSRTAQVAGLRDPRSQYIWHPTVRILSPRPAQRARPLPREQREEDDDEAVVADGASRVEMDGGGDGARHAAAGAGSAGDGADQTDGAAAFERRGRHGEDEEGKEEVYSNLPERFHSWVHRRDD